MRAMNWISSRGVLNTLCDGGLMQVWPCGTERASAISALTFEPGSTPPMPGFAPWLSLSSTIFTESWAALSANMSASNPPSLVRAPK
jgi:hypothetical protein